MKKYTAKFVREPVFSPQGHRKESRVAFNKRMGEEILEAIEDRYQIMNAHASAEEIRVQFTLPDRVSIDYEKLRSELGIEIISESKGRNTRLAYR